MAAIPVFKSTVSVLSEPEDICKYVLDTYIRTPKGINDTFREREVSLTYDIAKFTAVGQLLDVIKTNLYSVLINYFPANEIIVDVKSIPNANQSVSDLSISITVFKNGLTYSTTNEINIDQLGNIRVGR